MRNGRLSRIVCGIAIGLVVGGVRTAHAEALAPIDPVLPKALKLPAGDTFRSLHGIDAPGDALDSAYAHIGRRQFRDGGADLRDAADIIDREAMAATDAHRGRLQRDAGALRVIARSFESGRPPERVLLQYGLSQVFADLADHHRAKAAEAWDNEGPVVAEATLAGAARYVDRGFRALGEKPTSRPSESGMNNQALPKSREGTFAAFRAGCQLLGDEIAALRRAIQAFKSRWSAASPFDHRT